MSRCHPSAEPPDFGSLDGVVKLFRDPSGVFVGWLHYCVFDVLVGRWIVADAQSRQASILRHALVLNDMNVDAGTPADRCHVL